MQIQIIQQANAMRLLVLVHLRQIPGGLVHVAMRGIIGEIGIPVRSAGHRIQLGIPVTGPAIRNKTQQLRAWVGRFDGCAIGDGFG